MRAPVLSVVRWVCSIIKAASPASSTLFMVMLNQHFFASSSRNYCGAFVRLRVVDFKFNGLTSILDVCNTTPICEGPFFPVGALS